MTPQQLTTYKRKMMVCKEGWTIHPIKNGRGGLLYISALEPESTTTGLYVELVIGSLSIGTFKLYNDRRADFPGLHMKKHKYCKDFNDAFKTAVEEFGLKFLLQMKEEINSNIKPLSSRK